MGNDFSGAFIIGGLAGLSWLGYILTGGKIRSPHTFHIILFFFATWSAISIFWSLDTTVTFLTASLNFVGVALAIMFWDLLRKKSDFVTGLSAYIGGCYTVILIESSHLLLLDDAILGGVIISRNNIAATLVWGIPIAWYLSLHYADSHSRKRQYIAMLYLLISPIAILATRSRQGFVSIIIALLMISFFSLYLKGDLKNTVMIMFAGLASTFTVTVSVINNRVLPTGAANRIERTIQFLMGNISATEAGLDGRLEIYAAGIRAFQSNPLTGTGSGSFRTAAGQFGPSSQPHSTYLAISAETGIIGLSVFLIIILILLRGIVYSISKENMLAVSVLVLYLTISLVKTWFLDFTSIFLLTVVLIASKSLHK